MRCWLYAGQGSSPKEVAEFTGGPHGPAKVLLRKLEAGGLVYSVEENAVCKHEQDFGFLGCRPLGERGFIIMLTVGGCWRLFGRNFISRLSKSRAKKAEERN